jgi:hypothetical protein
MTVRDIEICCTATDNGRPVSLPGVGRGQRIISALVAGIGGRADWSFGPSGTCAALQIPAHRMRSMNSHHKSKVNEFLPL